MTLTINVLTGRRPELVQRTLDSFATNHPQVWGMATRTVLHNGGDQETSDVLDRFEWHDRQTLDRLLPIGEATARLAGQAKDAGCELVLRLEDDWEARPGDWWDDAAGLLEVVGQVRLRRSDERVSARCMVCRQTTRWKQHGNGETGHAHFTYNPTLMTLGTLLALFPHRDEQDAMRRFHPRPVGRLLPGVFAHIGGDGRSLRENGGGA